MRNFRVDFGAVFMALFAMISSLLACTDPVCAVVVAHSPSEGPGGVTIAGQSGASPIVVDDGDYAVVKLAANLFADDVQRVAAKRPAVVNGLKKPKAGSDLIVVGTLGRCALIDRLAAGRKLRGLDKIRGRWEATLVQVVNDPAPGFRRALVIAGSDRRGAAYGLMKLSEQIGVSPWYWWADAPIRRADALSAIVDGLEIDQPGVRYRGIFINDEDWGIQPWAAHTFDPEFHNIGPKTYSRVFELMLRLRLNYIWPAMHACSTEFGSVPANIALADQYGIVQGASHCEAMLYNNVHWSQKEKGPWNYSLNRDAIHDTWEESAKERAGDEAVWTLGIRGIHDSKMQEPPHDMPGKLTLMGQILKDERAILDQYAARQYGPVAQCFIPYKEVQTIYDAGLSLPPDVTLVWADDNFGYIRRFSDPQERSRPGGAGVYWHISYYGPPHSYTWINTTAPALMWEELHKAWENDARNLWMLNVGDIKPMEAGISYYARLAWNPDGMGPASQPLFLNDFASSTLGPGTAKPVADLLAEFYRLGTIRKPELMNRAWALNQPQSRADELAAGYADLIRRDQAIRAAIGPDERDAYIEMVGFPARVLADAGLIFMADRAGRLGSDPAANQTRIESLRADLQAQVDDYNTKIAGGKWKGIMPGLQTTRHATSWSSQVRWPWSEPAEPATAPTLPAARPDDARVWRDAASADSIVGSGRAGWTVVDGLGPSGRAVALEPASLSSSWSVGDKAAPSLQFTFQTQTAGDAQVLLDFMPTFRIYPGANLRVAAALDDAPPVIVEVPASRSEDTENSDVRRNAVQNNRATARIFLPGLTRATHRLKIIAVDPGVIIDRISLP